MNKIRNRLKSYQPIDIILAVYISIVTISLLLIYSGIFPPEIANYLNGFSIPGVSGAIVKIDEDYQNKVMALTNTFFEIGIITSFLSAIFIMRKKNFFELLAVLVAGMLPRQRNYWGTIFDVNNQKIIPFATVRALDKEGNLITQTVSDLNGRYRLLVKPGVTIVKLQVKSSGFKVYEKEPKTTLLSNRNAIAEDIGLEHEQSVTKVSQKTYYYFLRPLIYKILIVIIASLTLINFPIGIFAVLNNPVVVNFIFIFVNLVANIWNFSILFGLFIPKPGKILSALNQLPIANAQIELFDLKRKITAGLTNDLGIVKFDVTPGFYYIKASKSELTTELMPVEVDEKGFLTRNILLNLREDKLGATSKQQLPNPFS